MTTMKPTYEELEQRIIELEKEAMQLDGFIQRFRENELRLTFTQQVGLMGSWDRNIKTNEVFWSNQNYRNWGYAPKEIIPSFELVKSMIHSEDIQKFLELRDAALYQKEP